MSSRRTRFSLDAKLVMAEIAVFYVVSYLAVRSTGFFELERLPWNTDRSLMTLVYWPLEYLRRHLT